VADKSDATSAQGFDLSLLRAGTQLQYFGTGTVSGIEALTLKTGAGADKIVTAATVADLTNSFGYDDQIETNDGTDAVVVTGGRDTVDLGLGTDTFTVDWSAIGRSVSTLDLAGDRASGYSGIFFGDDSRYYNRVDFSGVEHFVVRTGGGNDWIQTGDGDDTLASGAGNDQLITGKGIDVVNGGDGDDRWDTDKSFAIAGQDILVDLTQTGVQSTYLGDGSVRGIEMLSLKTGAGADRIVTAATVADGNTFGFNDQIDTKGGADAVVVAGGRDTVAMGTGSDILTVDWTGINRSVSTVNADGTFFELTGSLVAGYSGAFFGDDSRYYKPGRLQRRRALCRPDRRRRRQHPNRRRQRHRVERRWRRPDQYRQGCRRRQRRAGGGSLGSRQVQCDVGAGLRPRPDACRNAAPVFRDRPGERHRGPDAGDGCGRRQDRDGRDRRRRKHVRLRRPDRYPQRSGCRGRDRRPRHGGDG
jgi:hypothetical protein